MELAEMLNAKCKMLNAICILHLAFCISGCTGPAPSAKRAARNVLLITIDTLRADQLGAYGCTRPSTPTFDRLPREGGEFDRAYAAAPTTLPWHAYILTGPNPPRPR